MTDNQKEFLMDIFFENEKYPGWRNIASKLIDSGKCIVAGTDCIWRGGIGNFIETEDAKDAVDCLQYSFDLDTFLSSKLFESVHEHWVEILKEQATQSLKKYNEILNIGKNELHSC